MRLHVVTSSGELGGAELSLVTFIEHRPPGLTLTASVIGGGELAARLRTTGLTVKEHPELTGRPTLGAAAGFVAGLTAELRHTRPDVVWAVGQKAATLAGPAARLARVPAVWHKVDLTRDRLAPALARATGRVLCVSEAAAAGLGGAHGRLLGVVGPPMRLPEELVATPDPERPVIGTLARLVGYKGHAQILRAAALLLPEYPALRVVLAGAPAREQPGHADELRALAAELGLGERLELPGFVPAESVLANLTIFVNATHVDADGFGREALSGAMLEAGWAGLPVVAVAGGGTAEGLIDGTTGTLVAAAEPELLAAAIAPYLGDPELAQRTGRAGAALARERYAPGPAAARLFALLATAAAEPG